MDINSGSPVLSGLFGFVCIPLLHSLNGNMSYGCYFFFNIFSPAVFTWYRFKVAWNSENESVLLYKLALDYVGLLATQNHILIYGTS